MSGARGPWIDLHGHPGRCFLLDGGHVTEALTAANVAGMSAVGLSTVADLAVLGFDANGGLGAVRDFEPGEARADHERQLRGLTSLLADAGTRVARTASEVEDAHARDETVVLLTCEGGDFLADDIGALSEAHDLGVSSLTLVHYRVNEIGDIQTEAPVHGGLTGFGRDVVAEANRLGIVIDCAHATLAVTRDVIDASADPVTISHSHLDHAERHHPRLLTDEHALALASAGGLIGAWPAGVTSTTLADFVSEIVRLVDLVGIEHVAIGTDMDANYKPVVTRYDELSSVAAALAARGLEPSETDRIMGGNALELLRRVCG